MSWSEADSEYFLDEGKYFVPERELQIEIICGLIPPHDGRPLLVELCCGEGLLTRALLEHFPTGRVHAFDGSPTMLESTRKTAGELADRLETRLFDLKAADWQARADAPHAVVSSLAVHHLDGGEKQALFRGLHAMLAPGGVFVLADLIAPASARGQDIAARTWDRAVEERARALDGNLAAFRRFQETQWNLYSDPDPDPVDKPSSLLDQMKWLEAAGFTGVDVHWMKGGHAIFSALKA
ncbi:MAG: class I SAM-dependent methyltransferase [Pseudomonadota bacterium]